MIEYCDHGQVKVSKYLLLKVFLKAIMTTDIQKGFSTALFLVVQNMKKHVRQVLHEQLLPAQLFVKL